MIKHGSPHKLEYSLIDDGIFIGTNVCCQTHFDQQLKDEGITVDISLEEERSDSPQGVEAYIWIPVKNYHAPTLDQLEFGVATLKQLVKQEKKVYVHCQNGHGRAPTLVAAYLTTKGLSADDAFKFVKSLRPAIHPEKSQIEAVQKLSKGYRS